MQQDVSCLQVADSKLANLWHRRYGHLSHKGLHTLQSKNMVEGLPKFAASTDILEPPFQNRASREQPLELIYSDICGPITPTSNNGKRYFISFIDDFSRKAWVYLLAEKSEAFSSFKLFKAAAEKESGVPIKCLRTDRGGEYLSAEFTKYCQEQGIRRQLTNAYTPHQNGIAERRNRIVMNMGENISSTDVRETQESNDENTRETQDTRDLENSEAVQQDLSPVQGRIREIESRIATEQQEIGQVQGRIRRAPMWHNDYVVNYNLPDDEAHMIQDNNADDPTCFAEALDLMFATSLVSRFMYLNGSVNLASSLLQVVVHLYGYLSLVSFNGKFSKFTIFWGECILRATFLFNRFPLSSLGFKTPYVGTLKHSRTKFDPRSQRCVFLGFDPNVKGYKVMDLASRRVFLSHDVIFDELVFSLENIPQGYVSVPLPLIIPDLVPIALDTISPPSPEPEQSLEQQEIINAPTR
ncbi:LOW QUALITY PROTEIN: hypothetical protein V2J09_005649 [Rumex salicifolius]